MFNLIKKYKKTSLVTVAIVISLVVGAGASAYVTKVSDYMYERMNEQLLLMKNDMDQYIVNVVQSKVDGLDSLVTEEEITTEIEESALQEKQNLINVISGYIETRPIDNNMYHSAKFQIDSYIDNKKNEIIEELVMNLEDEIFIRMLEDEQLQQDFSDLVQLEVDKARDELLVFIDEKMTEETKEAVDLAVADRISFKKAEFENILQTEIDVLFDNAAERARHSILMNLSSKVWEEFENLRVELINVIDGYMEEIDYMFAE